MTKRTFTFSLCFILLMLGTLSVQAASWGEIGRTVNGYFQANEIAFNVYTYITPIVVALILIEVTANFLLKKKLYTFQESVANFGTALGNQTTNVLVAAGVFVAYGWLYDNFRLFTFTEIHWYHHLILLLGIDFIFYWVHRWGHTYNIMWAAHSPHHSAEEMNYLVALRASVTMRLMSFLFFWPLTIIGFEPIHIYSMSGIHLLIAFWHHTELIRKMGKWIEFVFTTPSHHRVHHGVNFKYLDKNYSEFLIIWDRLFGTFQEEDEKVVYGMYSPPKSWNPLVINFHYFGLIWKDAVAAKNWWDKIRIWFMPLGWQPEGAPAKPPLEEIKYETQERFQTIAFPGAKPYLILYMVLSLLLMLRVINMDSPWSIPERIIGAGLLWAMVINWSGILSSSRWVWRTELLRILVTALLILYFEQNVLGAKFPFFNVAILLLSLGSLVWTWYYFRPQNPSSVSLST